MPYRLATPADNTYRFYLAVALPANPPISGAQNAVNRGTGTPVHTLVCQSRISLLLRRGPKRRENDLVLPGRIRILVGDNLEEGVTYFGYDHFHGHL